MDDVVNRMSENYQDFAPDDISDDFSDFSDFSADMEAVGEDTRSFLIPVGMDGKRLDACLSELLPDQSRSFLQKQITAGNVLLGEEEKPVLKAGRKMKSAERVRITLPPPQQPDIQPENIPLDILYEDDDIIVVNKPKGMVVHPAPGHYSGTLVNALMYHCGDSLSGINGVMRPGIVHRIDRDTTGSLLVCKNDSAHRCLAGQLKEHSISRRYRALVCGNIPKDSGTVDAPIGRHPVDRKKMAVNERNGRRAVTHFQVLERFGPYTYIECRLETGRTHQIRVHMASIGHPLLGDSVYGPARCPFHLQGQCLHAMTLGFIHPSSGEYVEFSAPLPDYFEALLKNLRGRS